MKKSLIYWSVFLASFSGFAERGPRPLFERRPEERERKAYERRVRAESERADAHAWAKAHGMPTRYELGLVTRELVSVENGKPIYYTTLNANAAISTAANQIRETAPFNLDGAGVKVGVWDAGEALVSHVEFSGGRCVNADASPMSNWHATHVAGTIGAGGTNASAKGMAPAISIDSYDWNTDLAEMTAAAASGPGQPTKLYLSNHSYGVPAGWDYGSWVGTDDFGRYHALSRELDELVHDAEYYLVFWAAGNDRDDTGTGHPGDGEYKDGFDTISFHGVAKNIMTVGAVSKAVSGGARSLGSAGMGMFSSWGPVDDGRIKPDIVAQGVSLYSADDLSDSAYTYASGTSMAAPNACGSAALLVEYYKELFAGGAMRASTLKGLIIHTADDMGRAGPDYEYGWGLMNTLAAAETLKAASDGHSNKVVEATVGAGDPSDNYVFDWNGIDPIRVTLCWTDPEGGVDMSNDDRTPDLVNDLDLKVTGPDGVNYPYKLSYANPTNLATASAENDVDNVEQVLIENPVAGSYTVTVDYDGALTGGSQWYSLFVSGNFDDTDLDGLSDAWELFHFLTPTGALASADADGDGADNLAEFIAGTSPMDGGSVFEVLEHGFGASNTSPYTVSWSAVEGRVYNVRYSGNLALEGFASISGDLAYPTSNYVDSVDRSTNQAVFYDVQVRLAD